MIAIIFEQFGPYHHARVAALQAASEVPVIPMQMAAQTTVYEWANAAPVQCKGLVTLCPGRAEALSPVRLFLAARRFFTDHKIECALLPSYAPATSLAVLFAAMSCGVRRVMMNESHAGTERATGWKRVLKRWLVGRFHAALVGGTPQKRHFTTLGMKPEKIFTGYDAIDNAFFANEADRVRQDANAWRSRLGLPSRYILSLGRMVEKKNLGTLVEAYAALRQRFGDSTPALVFVGSGDQETSLRQQCTHLGLRVADLTGDRGQGAGWDRGQKSEVGGQRTEDGEKSEIGDRRSEPSDISSSSPTSGLRPPTSGEVFFAGFRQIDENPAFYALAECFVLPSLYEEWGLVVNEAMACGLPVIVSKTVGSAEDLVLHGDNGFHIDPNQTEELTEALACLSIDPELRKRMGACSREIIDQWGCDRFAQNALAACATSVVRSQS